MSGTKGGYWRLELFDGGSKNGARARCDFRGANGKSTFVVAGKQLDDGRRHTVTCSRTGGKVAITVDGKMSSNSFSLDRIANTAEITIGAEPTGGDAYLGLLRRGPPDLPVAPLAVVAPVGRARSGTGGSADQAIYLTLCVEGAVVCRPSQCGGYFSW